MSISLSSNSLHPLKLSSLIKQSSPSPSPNAHLILAPHRPAARILALSRCSKSFRSICKASGVDDGEVPHEVANSSAGQPPPPIGPKLPIPNIPAWAVWTLVSVGFAGMPAYQIYQRILRIEDQVEKAAETVIEAAEEVSEVVEKVATNVANSLPENNRLREEVMAVKHLAEQVDEAAEKAEELIQEVDRIKDEIKNVVEPMIEKGELIRKQKRK